MLCGLLTPDAGEGQVLASTSAAKPPRSAPGGLHDPEVRALPGPDPENPDFVARLFRCRTAICRRGRGAGSAGPLAHAPQLAGALSGGWKQRRPGCLPAAPSRACCCWTAPAGVDPKGSARLLGRIAPPRADEGITVLVPPTTWTRPSAATNWSHRLRARCWRKRQAASIVAASGADRSGQTPSCRLVVATDNFA